MVLPLGPVRVPEELICPGAVRVIVLLPVNSRPFGPVNVVLLLQLPLAQLVAPENVPVLPRGPVMEPVLFHCPGPTRLYVAWLCHTPPPPHLASACPCAVMASIVANAAV